MKGAGERMAFEQRTSASSHRALAQSVAARTHAAAEG